MNHKEILGGVQECLARVLDIRPDEVHEADRIIGDLGADSLDLLDLVFQLEQKFKVTIALREMERQAQDRLNGRPVEIDGVYTPDALAELRRALPEIPAEELPEGLTTADLPRRFRVATMVNLVAGLLEKKNE